WPGRGLRVARRWGFRPGGTIPNAHADGRRSWMGPGAGNGLGRIGSGPAYTAQMYMYTGRGRAVFCGKPGDIRLWTRVFGGFMESGRITRRVSLEEFWGSRKADGISGTGGRLIPASGFHRRTSSRPGIGGPRRSGPRRSAHGSGSRFPILHGRRGTG